MRCSARYCEAGPETERLRTDVSTTPGTRPQEINLRAKKGGCELSRKITDDAANILDEGGYSPASKKDGGVAVRAITWAEVVENAKHRMKFVQHGLEIEPSKAQGIAYLRAAHASSISDVVHESEEDEVTGASSTGSDE